MKIVLIGAGNVATHIGLRLIQTGAEILQVFSRSETSAKALADKLSVPFCIDVSCINHDADIYIYSLTDSALDEIISRIKIPKKVHIHTAGSISMDIFENRTDNYGVVYPLQTFSKTKAVDFQNIPLFLEANNEFTSQIILELAQQLSNVHYFINSEKRRKIHLAAVFACNFTNYMYQLADEIISEAQVPFDVLLPLIQETADKVRFLSPREAQTGPAVRKDEITIQNHLELLKTNDNARNIYQTISEQIKESHPS